MTGLKYATYASQLNEDNGLNRKYRARFGQSGSFTDDLYSVGSLIFRIYGKFLPPRDQVPLELSVQRDNLYLPLDDMIKEGKTHPFSRSKVADGLAGRTLAWDASVDKYLETKYADTAITLKHLALLITTCCTKRLVAQPSIKLFLSHPLFMEVHEKNGFEDRFRSYDTVNKAMDEHLNDRGSIVFGDNWFAQLPRRLQQHFALRSVGSVETSEEKKKTLRRWVRNYSGDWTVKHLEETKKAAKERLGLDTVFDEKIQPTLFIGLSMARRNLRQHIDGTDRDIAKIVGLLPQKYFEYWQRLFPTFFLFLYFAGADYTCDLNGKGQYFCTHPDFVDYFQSNLTGSLSFFQVSCQVLGITWQKLGPLPTPEKPWAKDDKNKKKQGKSQGKSPDKSPTGAVRKWKN